MTTTTTNLADIPRGTLVLVTVADDIPADCPPGQERGATAEERTYFATRSRDMGEGWLCLVVPESDPRHRGMWRLDYDGYGLPPAEEGTQHYGWNVRAEYVTPYDGAAFTEEDSPALAALARAREEGRREGRAEIQRQWEAWKAEATEIAHRYAEENNLCGEFDRAMEEIGLPSRSYSYTAEVTLTVTYDGERGDDVYAALRRHFLHSCDTDEITVDDVSVSDVERQSGSA